MRTQSSLPSAFVVALLAAIGCEPAPRDDAVSETPVATRPSPADSLENWMLSADAYGPLRVGMTKQAIATLVPGTFSVPSPTEPGGCGYAVWDSVPPGMRLMFAGDTLVRVEADSASTATLLGARVGDSAARIDSLYGPNVRRMPHKYTSGQYLIAFSRPPVDTLYRVVFETDSASGKVTKMRAGRLPEAEWVEGCS